MLDLTYDKTEKGREEILSRKYQIATRLRSLLVMVDGKHNRQQLLEKVAGLGINETHLDELINSGFIEGKTQSDALVSEAEAAPAPVIAQTEQASSAQLTETTPQLSDSERFQAIYQFYTETIKANLGLRGFTLQLKVEKAANLDDFRELRTTYLEAVIKAKGREMARALRDRLDSLLGDASNFEI